MSTVADATSDINANPPWVETHGYIQTSLRDKETRLRQAPDPYALCNSFDSCNTCNGN